MRAQLCADLANARGAGRPASFLAGLMSTIDALPRLPMASALRAVPIGIEVRATLVAT